MNPDVTLDLNPANVSQLNDADMQAVPAALARAAVRARELALSTGTPLVVRRDGRVVEVDVQPNATPTKDGHLPAH